MPSDTGESAAATAAMLTLEHCSADAHVYACIVTSGATAALALLADAFPWTPGRSHFLPQVENHTYAAPYDAHVCAIATYATPPLL
jgi:molybdenum cofactor sulfurtransferase